MREWVLTGGLLLISGGLVIYAVVQDSPEMVTAVGIALLAPLAKVVIKDDEDGP